MLRQNRGFSLLELLISVAVIGIISAVAIPAYRSYLDTANMTRVTANFEEGIRIARGLYVQQEAKLAVGLDAGVPSTTEDWILLFNKTGVLAPGGGPAYIASTNNTASRGDATTGAVGVQYVPYMPGRSGGIFPDTPSRAASLRMWRPLYLSLVEQIAVITPDSIQVQILRTPSD